MNKRTILSVVIILLAVASVGGATAAWFTDLATVTNTFSAGTLEIGAEDYWKSSESSHWDNVNPGDCEDKVFKIINKGSKHSLLRFQFSGEWGEYEIEGDEDSWLTMAGQDAGLVTVSAPDGWFFYNGWWYYNEILLPDMDPEEPFTFELRVCIDGPGTVDKYQGMSYKLDFDFEAVQASNNASGSQWGVDSWYYSGGIPVEPDLDTYPNLDRSATNWAEFDPAIAVQPQ